jgi:hypothetical protein
MKEFMPAGNFVTCVRTLASSFTFKPWSKRNADEITLVITESKGAVIIIHSAR